MNGLLSGGLTNAFYFMFVQIQKANLNFDSYGPTALRTQQVLRNLMLDTNVIQIIDMKAELLNPTLDQLKQLCMDSVISYIQGLLMNFITAFIVFITLLTIAVIVLVFVGFKILRRSMWDTNIILKIIPFETLPKKDRIEIKDFFNS